MAFLGPYNAALINPSLVLLSKGIGVDSDQDNLFPGHVLTSMVKRVDTQAYDMIKAVKDGSFKGGTVTYYGLKEGGVDWSYDRYNKVLITPAMKAKVEQAKADIIAGRIKVHDYASDNRCGA